MRLGVLGLPMVRLAGWHAIALHTKPANWPATGSTDGAQMLKRGAMYADTLGNGPCPLERRDASMRHITASIRGRLTAVCLFCPVSDPLVLLQREAACFVVSMFPLPAAACSHLAASSEGRIAACVRDQKRWSLENCPARPHARFCSFSQQCQL